MGSRQSGRLFSIADIWGRTSLGGDGLRQGGEVRGVSRPPAALKPLFRQPGSSSDLHHLHHCHDNSWPMNLPFTILILCFDVG